MNRSSVVSYFNALNTSGQEKLLREFQTLSSSGNYLELIEIRGNALDDKRAECSYFDSSHYINQVLIRKVGAINVKIACVLLLNLQVLGWQVYMLRIKSQPL